MKIIKHDSLEVVGKIQPSNQVHFQVEKIDERKPFTVNSRDVILEQ